jgi:DNA-binding beta-propeller fold protein YncE
MDSAEMTAGPVPADPGAEAPAPTSPDQEQPASRRKLIVLLVMLFVFLLLALVAAWYLLFHKPLTEVIPGVTAPQTMPAYQGSLYNLSKPQSVAVSTDATRLVITQTGTSLETVMFDRQGNKVAVLAPPTDQVPSPHQLFVATDPATGEFWATDRFNGLTAIYTASGKFDRLFDPGTALQNWQPLAIGFDKTGDAYIADVSNGPAVILVFGPDGKELRSFGPGHNLDHPNGIAVADNGMVYVADTGNGQLKVFDPSGGMIGSIDRGAASGNLGLPVGVAIDDHGNVLVVDSNAARVQAYAQLAAGQDSPNYINAFGEEGSGDANFSYPNGLAADAQGRVYVADWGNDRLEIWGY